MNNTTTKNTNNLPNLPGEVGDLGSFIKLDLEGPVVTSLPPSTGQLQAL